jgi:hypothetical protein
MKTKRFVSLVSAFVASASLVGCARDAGKTPNSAQHSDTHGLYWHANSKDSVAKMLTLWPVLTLLLMKKQSIRVAMQITCFPNC